MIYLSRSREKQHSMGCWERKSVASYVLFLIGVHRIIPPMVRIGERVSEISTHIKEVLLCPAKQTGSKQYRPNAR